MRRDSSLIPLSRQHHNALSLCVLTERALAGDTAPANLERLARRVIDRYEIELANHFELEEELLFPAVRGVGLETMADELAAEHRQMERLVAALRDRPEAAVLHEFTSLLRRHVRREENELFEEAQRRLGREILDRLGGELEARAVRVCL